MKDLKAILRSISSTFENISYALLFGLSLLFVFLFVLSGTSYAEPKVFTNEDLEKYDSAPMFHSEEQANPKESTTDNDDKNREIKKLKERLDRVERREVESKQQTNEPVLPGLLRQNNCKVESFSTYDCSYGYLGEDRRVSLSMQQCVLVTVKNYWGVSRFVSDVKIYAVFDDNTLQVQTLMSLDGKPKMFFAGDTYEGRVVFSGTSSIVEIGCEIGD